MNERTYRMYHMKESPDEPIVLFAKSTTRALQLQGGLRPPNTNDTKTPAPLTGY